MCRSIGARARAFESVGLKCVLLEKTERKECLDRGTFWGGVGCFFARIFSPFLRSRRKDTKKNTTRSALKTTSANRTQTSLSLSLSLISLPADTIMRRILLPIDSTGEDVDVLKWVIENVHRAGDQIVLLHVYVSLFLFFFILLSRM